MELRFDYPDRSLSLPQYYIPTGEFCAIAIGAVAIVNELWSFGVLAVVDEP